MIARSLNKLLKVVGIALIPIAVALFVQSYLFNGETITEYSDIYPGSTVENIKTGSSLTVCRKTADGGRMSAKYGRTSEKAICALLKSLCPILPRRSHNE